MHGACLFFKKTGKDNGQQCNPDVLTAEEGAAHLRKHPTVRRNQRRKGTADEFRDGHDNNTIGNAHGDVAEGDILAPPVRRCEGLSLCRHALFLNLVNQGMLIETACESIARDTEQDQKVDRHVEVVRNDSRRDERPADLERIRECRKVHAAADVGTGHHRCHLRQSVDGVLQECAADHRARDCPDRADEEDRKQLPRLAPDLADVRLKQQERNRKRDEIPPDNIVIDRCGGGNDTRIDERQCNDKCDDRPRDARCPCITLLKVNRGSHRRHHDGHKNPCVFG